jgi:hypothetical protein
VRLRCRLPLYNEAKIGLVFWLAYGGGAEHLYATIIQPLLLEHESAIDEGVYQARTWLHAHVQNNIGWCARARSCLIVARGHATLQCCAKCRSARSASVACKCTVAAADADAYSWLGAG